MLSCSFTCPGSGVIPNGLWVRSESTRATVFWRPSRPCVRNVLIEGYDIYLKKCNSRGSETTIHVRGARSRSHLLGPLSPATEYSLRIAAVNSEGIGPLSRPVLFATEEL